MADEALGKVKIEHEVLSAIAATAAGKVKGVTKIIPGFVGIIEEFLGRHAPQHSVRVSVKEGQVLLELSIEVTYGSDIPQVCWEVQKEVKASIEAMTGMKVAKVDVEVRGLKAQKSGD